MADFLAPASVRTFRTVKPLFVGPRIGVVVILGALTFLSPVSVRPMVKQFSHRRFF